ncbi:MAG: PIN domain-containing protein [bacterium]
MPAFVLDSFALLAYFRDEPGAAAVEALLEQAAVDRPLHMTEVNYAEVKNILVRRDGLAGWESAARILQGLPIQFHPVARELADGAAELKARFSISLADAFAAALAKAMRAELVTGDAEFKPLAREVRVRWLA